MVRRGLRANLSALADRDYAIWTVSFIGVWQGFGFNMVLYLAGLTSIPRDLYDAAEMDGSTSAWERFRLVTWPMLGPTTVFVVTISLIRSFQVFDMVEAFYPQAMPPGKVHRYLVSLTRAGLVEQDAASGRYGIGPAAIALGLAGLRQLDPIRSASEVLATLRDEVGETAVLAIWGNRGPVVVRILESSQPVSMNMRPGYVLPVRTSAIGLVFSAYLPASVRASVAAGAGETPPSDADPSLDDELAAIRDRGMLGASGIMVPGVSVLAAPYFDHEGAIAGVLALLGREGDLDVSRGGEPARCLDAATAEITGRLGGSAANRGPSASRQLFDGE